MELDFNVLWKVAAVVFAAGGLWNELRAIRKDLSRLESKRINITICKNVWPSWKTVAPTRISVLVKCTIAGGMING